LPFHFLSFIKNNLTNKKKIPALKIGDFLGVREKNYRFFFLATFFLATFFAFLAFFLAAIFLFSIFFDKDFYNNIRPLIITLLLSHLIILQNEKHLNVFLKKIVDNFKNFFKKIFKIKKQKLKK